MVLKVVMMMCLRFVQIDFVGAKCLVAQCIMTLQCQQSRFFIVLGPIDNQPFVPRTPHQSHLEMPWAFYELVR